jgi:hypothetical protein
MLALMTLQWHFPGPRSFLTYNCFNIMYPPTHPYSSSDADGLNSRLLSGHADTILALDCSSDGQILARDTGTTHNNPNSFPLLRRVSVERKYLLVFPGGAAFLP